VLLSDPVSGKDLVEITERRYHQAMMQKSLLLVLSFCIFAGSAFGVETGTLRKPIIDSKMSKKEVFDGLDPKCPPEIRKRQKIVKVKYYSFDGKVHQGQLVIDKDLVKDIKIIFELALEIRFPIHSVIPVSHPDFRKNGRWDDDLSMIANNTSAFNYREKTGGGSLSNHAYGRAIDINTVQNPYIKGSLILPPNGSFNPSAPGTLTADHPITKKFIELGWDWGGSWTRLLDYQHFEKPIKTTTD
jgi:peptidoglycan L-alanyl-D-glutamate endopeptidase CwlK